jgi:hypothetical protein
VAKESFNQAKTFEQLKLEKRIKNIDTHSLKQKK